MTFNQTIFQIIHSYSGIFTLLDKLGVFFAEYFGYFLLFFSLILFLWKQDYKKVIILGWLSALVSRFIVTEIIRYFYFQSRPFEFLSITPLVAHTSTASFPSGHASFYFALAFTIFFKNKKLGAFFLVGSFLIGLARIYCALHWPLDILGGVIVGFFVAILIKKLLGPI